MTAFRYCLPADLRARYGPKPVLSQLSSVTSNAAARRLEPRQRARLVEAVYQDIAASLDGLTDEEGIAATGIPASTYRPRRIELVEANRVFDSHRTRLTKARRRAAVWQAR